MTVPATTDLYDAFEAEVEVLELPGLRPFGGAAAIAGPIRTLKVFEDNALVREMLSSPGDGAVLIIDGGGSLRYALLGDQLAELAVKNGWAGVIVHGAIRDSAAIAQMPLGVWALGTIPRKTVKRGEGQRDVPVRFGGTTFRPGAYVYADVDGVLVAPRALTLD